MNEPEWWYNERDITLAAKNYREALERCRAVPFILKPDTNKREVRCYCREKKSSGGLPALRDRDGSKCWLCLFPVDWSLRGKNHPCAPTIDHVRERRNGGCNHMENLRLAHAFCNHARHMGVASEKFKNVHQKKVAAILKERGILYGDGIQ